MNISRIARRPQVALAAAAVAATALLAVGLQSPSAQAAAAGPAGHQQAGGTRPVIVLEHGAWADASSWSGVITDLQRAGFTVYAPPNPLRGLSSDSDYLRDFLTENPALQGKPVVLAGHSYGGAVITNAAVGDPEVKALVYVDAFIPAQGQTVEGLLSKVPGSCIADPGTSFLPVPYPDAPANSADLYLQASKFPGCFANGLTASEAAELAATQRPLASAAVTEASGTPAWATVPSWAVVGTADKVIPPAELLAMAAQAGAHVTKVNAGHLSLISDPGAIARVIVQAASAAS
jgi:pimeloyl-ACP methyl ester carboxylesterase